MSAATATNVARGAPDSTGGAASIASAGASAAPAPVVPNFAKLQQLKELFPEHPGAFLASTLAGCLNDLNAAIERILVEPVPSVSAFDRGDGRGSVDMGGKGAAPAFTVPAAPPAAPAMDERKGGSSTVPKKSSSESFDDDDDEVMILDPGVSVNRTRDKGKGVMQSVSNEGIAGGPSRKQVIEIDLTGDSPAPPLRTPLTDALFGGTQAGSSRGSGSSAALPKPNSSAFISTASAPKPAPSLPKPVASAFVAASSSSSSTAPPPPAPVPAPAPAPAPTPGVLTENDKLALLVDMFPDADPDYLLQSLRKYRHGPTGASDVDLVTTAVLESNGAYPKRQNTLSTSSSSSS
ncbi:hypothetical protein HK102_001093, partial [Quaeritorhiza haematococci]